MIVYNLPEIDLETEGSLVIFGTGDVARQYYEQLAARNRTGAVAFFLDSVLPKEQFFNKKVYRPGEFPGGQWQKYRYLVASVQFADSIKEILLEKGVAEEAVIMPTEQPCQLSLYVHDRNRKVDSVAFYPVIEDREVLERLLAKLDWFLPRQDMEEKQVILYSDLEAEGTSGEHIRVLSAAEAESAGEADIILAWDQGVLKEPLVKANRDRVYCVDPAFYAIVELQAYMVLYYLLLDPAKKDYYHELSRENYRRHLAGQEGKKKAFVFGSGPSVQEAYNFDYSGGYRVICNGIVYDDNLVAHINPDLVTFADNAFFNNLEEAFLFRKKAFGVIDNYGADCMIPYYSLPLVLARYPRLERKLIGMPYRDSFNFPTVGEFYVRLSSYVNITTLFMLPAASTVAEDIYILGCDGIEPGRKLEKNILVHYNSAQYDRLMEKTGEDSVSFYRDVDYSEVYYRNHCLYMQELIEFGEKRGKRYQSLTSSHMPVLKARPARE